MIYLNDVIYQRPENAISEATFPDSHSVAAESLVVINYV